LTCYFRHLKKVFLEARITITKENKKDIDRVNHDVVGVEYKNCSATWKEVKNRITDNREDFISELQKKIKF
jgi:hypothetical protein